MKATNIAYPFRTLPTELIECAPWIIKNVSDDMAPVYEIEHWDYDTEIQLERNITQYFFAVECQHHIFKFYNCGLHDYKE